MLLVKYIRLFQSKNKKQIKEDNAIKNNYVYIQLMDLNELKLLKYKCEMKAKKLRNRTTTMTTFTAIMTIVLSLISTSTKIVEKYDIYQIFNILEVFILYIISITSVGIHVKLSLDMASEYETLAVMIKERIAEINGSY